MDDLISRQAVMDLYMKWRPYMAIRLYEFEKELKKLPPVKPEQKMGHWIMSEDGLYRPICDKCSAHPWKGYIPTTKEATEVFKYCPNCGAKMEGEE